MILLGIAAIFGGTIAVASFVEKQREQWKLAEAQKSGPRPPLPGPAPKIAMDQLPSDLPGDVRPKTTALNMLNDANHGALKELLEAKRKEAAAKAKKEPEQTMGKKPKEPARVAAAPAAPKPRPQAKKRLSGGGGLSSGIGQDFAPVVGGEN